MAEYLIQDTTLTEIANAVKAKTGGTGSLSPSEMASGLNAIAERGSSDLTASGSTVTVPAGNYKSQATKSVATATQVTPSISVDSNGLITASATQTAGYVSAGTKSATKQLTTKAAATITPKTSNQTIAAGTYLTGVQTIAGDADLVADNIKKGVNIFGVSGAYDADKAVLNFKVVGGTSAPSDPSENTIWVNTNHTITSWYFGVDKPSVYGEGAVWISAGTSSQVKFNALKNNGIQVSPLLVYQYVSGEWVNKTAKSYQGGSWVDWWNGELYVPGNEWESVTGGWESRALRWESILDGAPPTITNNNGVITITPNANRGGAYNCKNKIDLTNYNTLVFDGKSYPNSGYTDTVQDNTSICVWRDFGAVYTENLIAKRAFGNTSFDGILTLDVSNVDEKCYVGIMTSRFYSVDMRSLRLE